MLLQLSTQADWEPAGHAYAAAHDRYYDVIHRVEQRFADLFMEKGPAAESRQARALPLSARDATRMPDVLFSGPDLPVDEATRGRFFGEE